MALTIDQFMWQWQHFFRIDVEVTLDQALKQLGAALEPIAFLVGFTDDPAARHAICVEPETGPLSPEVLALVSERGTAIYEADPERQIFNTDPGVHERRQAWLRRRARATALAEAVEASECMPGKRVICSSGGMVNGYEVHSCVAVDAARFDALPVLPGEDVNRFPAPSSLVGHLIALVLTEADIAVGPDADMYAIRKSAEDLARTASGDFAAGCAYRSGNFRSPYFLHAITLISQRTYEGASAGGRLLLTKSENADIEVSARLATSVPLSSTRRVRKLLETTDHSTALLVDDSGVFGFGSAPKPDAHDVFEIAVTSHATFELRTQDVGLLRISYGAPSLPQLVLDTEHFADVCRRVLGSSAPTDLLTKLVSTASLASHGTTLVVTTAAETEANRLAGQSTLLHAVPLTDDLLAHVCRIDGAVIIDPDGMCFAIGVILDGDATGEGDPARGARYNSALRYQRAAKSPTVAVVVSEDGDVTLLPALRPQIRRQQVLDALSLLDDAAGGSNPAAFADAFSLVENLAFYLTAEQCAHANDLAATEEEIAMSRGNLAIIRPTLNPAQEFDDSYFL